MPNIYYTSDLHIGHDMVATLRGFDSAERHDAAIMENWNDTVRERDIVYILGDLTLKNPNRPEVKAFIKELNGTKRLIYGNHDAGHPMHKGWEGKQAVYAEMFQVAQPFGRRKINGVETLMSHFPYQADRHEIRHDQYRLKDKGVWLLHGHTHDNGDTGHPREIHVGLDTWDLAPIPEAWIVAIMQKRLLLEEVDG